MVNVVVLLPADLDSVPVNNVATQAAAGTGGCLHKLLLQWRPQTDNLVAGLAVRLTLVHVELHSQHVSALEAFEAFPVVASSSSRDSILSDRLHTVTAGT